MNIEDIREYCLSLQGASECFPFDDMTLVFKVSGKMFALVNLDGDLSINLKCDPEKAIALREHFPSVLPGYHMNKKYWNTVLIDGIVSDKMIEEWITDSYWLVLKKSSQQLKPGQDE